MNINTLKVLAVLLALNSIVSLSHAKSLRVLAWPGYVSDSAISEFEKRHQVDVLVSVIETDDQMWQQFNHPLGQEYDVLSLNTAELQRYIDENKVQPLDLRLIPNQKNQRAPFDKMEKIQGLTRNSQTYAIPFTYSEMGLIYSKKEFSQAPKSWKVLWDPKYQGRVLAYEGSVHNFTLAALSVGEQEPFVQNDEQLRRNADRLIELRRNVRAFYSSPAQSLEYMLNEDIVLAFANYGSQQIKALQDKKLAMGYTIPEEGALAWLDTWAINQKSTNVNLAHLWINFMLSKSVSEQLTAEQGLANTITSDNRKISAAQIHWLEPVEDLATRSHLWQQIQSGVGEVSFKQ